VWKGTTAGEERAGVGGWGGGRGGGAMGEDTAALAGGPVAARARARVRACTRHQPGRGCCLRPARPPPGRAARRAWLSQVVCGHATGATQGRPTAAAVVGTLGTH
jgi:hypothetical protein